MTSPRVSVVIPAYNAGAFIEQAVNSVLAQTFQDFEVIIVSDGSTDNTARVLNRYERDSRVRVITLSSNSGESIATNIAITAARGEYIARLDADDIALPDRLLYQVDVLDNNSWVTVTGAQVDTLDESTGIRAPLKWTARSDADIKSALLDGGYHFITSTTMWRRAWFLERNIWWNASLPSGRDHRFWIDAMLAGAGFANLDRVLAVYRWHATNISHDVDSVLASGRANRDLVVRSFFPQLPRPEAMNLAPLLETQYWGTNHLTDVDSLRRAVETLERMRPMRESIYGENRALLSEYIDRWFDIASRRIAELASVTVRPAHFG
ncbi:glycosyltransferase family 2 protein [Caballeronia novacaledonica]|uniref:Glycosyltransferase family 2 protein n=1 Tax=Caballeronia novacaledonica TaxID=1544861 RepID=A0ACB5R0E4_9BURK|nr:glycosyltransferase family 2 protein [Caballeronia novacaledonica]